MAEEHEGAGKSPETFEERWAIVDDRRMRSLSCRRVTSEPPVVLVHGLVVASTYLMPTARALAADWQVWVPELPGYGESERPEETLDVDGLAACLAAWMHAEGIGRAHLVANSVGCQTALSLAQHWPSLVDHLVLTSPTLDPRARSFVRPLLRWMRNAPMEPLSLLPIVVNDWRKAGLKRSLESYLVLLDDVVEERLPHVRAPTLLVRGERDPVSPGRWLDEMARLMPNARVAYMRRVAHTVNYTAPRELARLCTSFFLEERGERDRREAEARHP